MSYRDNFNMQIVGEGSSPKVVLLHGLMGSGANWRKIASQLKEEFQVLTYDQRGHGRSFQPETGYAPEDYADDLLCLLDELGWEEIFLLGHSMGGRSALNFAHRFPHRVTRLIIEDIGAEPNQELAGAIEHLLSLCPVPFESKKRAREFFLLEFAKKIPENPNAQILSQYFYTNIIERPDGTASWRFSKNAILESVERGWAVARWNEVEGLKVPTKIIRGSKSKELLQETYQRMINSAEDMVGVVIPNAAHWVHFDQPEAFYREVYDFFSL